MIRVTQVDEDGTERATVELDDFTVEILYSGIAIMLRRADCLAGPQPPAKLSGDARARRARVLARLTT